MSDAKRLKALEDENTRLKKFLAEAMLDNAIVARQNFFQCVTDKVAAARFLSLGDLASVSGPFNAPFNPT